MERKQRIPEQKQETYVRKHPTTFTTENMKYNDIPNPYRKHVKKGKEFSELFRAIYKLKTTRDN